MNQKSPPMKARLRDALILRYVEGRDYPDIARQLACSEAAVRKRVNRGVANVRKRLQRAGYAAPEGAVLAALSFDAAHRSTAQWPRTMVQNALSQAAAGIVRRNIGDGLFDLTYGCGSTRTWSGNSKRP